MCVNLVGKHVDSTVNNPIECVSHWKAGRVRPLAVFDSARIEVPEWKDIPKPWVARSAPTLATTRNPAQPVRNPVA